MNDSTVPAVKFPNVKVQLSGRDGNAFAILGAVQKAMHRAGIGAEDIAAFRAEATAGDYDQLLRAAMRWVDVS